MAGYSFFQHGCYAAIDFIARASIAARQAF
jgi:hypothetical protein